MQIGLSIGLTGQQPRSLLARALSAIRRLGGTALYVPDDYRGAFVDSTGTQPVTAVGDLVGLLTDRSYGASNLGVNFAPSTNTTTGWGGAGTSTISTVGGSLRITSNSVGVVSARVADNTIGGFVVGRTYKISGAISTQGGTISSSGVPAISVRDGTTTVGTASAATSAGGVPVSVIFVATNTSLTVRLRWDSSITVDLTSYFDFSQLVLTEVLGSHAVQGTTASKPLVTRVPKRLGSNLVVNGGFDTDTSGWTAKSAGTTMSVVSGAMRVTGTGAWVETYTSFPTVSGRMYRLAANVVAAKTNVRANLSSTSFSAAELGNGVALTTAGGRMYYEFTAVSATTFLVLRNNGTGPESFDVDNISVQEVLEWSNALDFDGSNDLLTLSSGAILQQGTDHFVTAAFVLDAVGVVHTIYGTTSTAAVNPFVAVIRVNADGTIGADWRDDTGVQRVLLASSFVASAGVPCVVTVAKVGANRSLWVNGTSQATSTTTVGTTTANTTNIGALVRTTTSEYLNGKLIDLVVDQGTLTEADRKTIERNMAQRAGVTYAG